MKILKNEFFLGAVTFAIIVGAFRMVFNSDAFSDVLIDSIKTLTLWAIILFILLEATKLNKRKHN